MRVTTLSVIFDFWSNINMVCVVLLFSLFLKGPPKTKWLITKVAITYSITAVVSYAIGMTDYVSVAIY